MPQFNIATFPPQVIWLAITFVVLYILMARVALPRIGNVLSERQEKIDDNLEAAEQLRTQAKADADAYTSELTKAREAARAAIAEATQEVSSDAAAKAEALGQRLAAQIKSAEAEIEKAKASARTSIRDAAIGVAQAATQRLIGTAPAEPTTAAAVDSALQARS
jgi:F-type H+-transporting ATPase subunit b